MEIAPIDQSISSSQAGQDTSSEEEVVAAPRRGLFRPSAAGIALFVSVFLGISVATRLVLAIRVHGELDWRAPAEILGVFGFGLLYDLAAASYFTLPVTLYLLLCSPRWFSRPWHRRLLSTGLFAMMYLLMFIAVAEWLFWDEFGARFNFIAVDYLIYTKEVLGNIHESYSVPLIVAGVLGASVLLFTAICRVGVLRSAMTNEGLSGLSRARRLRVFAPFLAAPILFTVFLNSRQLPGLGNTYRQELARNGIYSLFAEFRNNELPYEQFYPTLDETSAFARARNLLQEKNARFVSTNQTDLTREIVHPGPEKRWNVIQITVESLSAEFMAAFGNKKDLTPSLDALTKESLFFTNLYATGTRTVRGMEALTLSLPPTPGQSIVRRPNNQRLFSLGSVFRERGYDTTFIYGGYGYFDNMNAFFSGNGYRVVDRAAVPSSNITFANAWGACDQDVFKWSMKEADDAFARGQPFFHFVMTTSNHRPYTYPAGQIDIPSGTGRKGAVKYTDFAIGEFIQRARTKPWFTNTLFVVVADHCASSAGRTDLPINDYRIPLLIYNPGLVQPERMGTLCSQIDYAPTLLALLNWSYTSRFFGKNVLAMKPEDGRAYIATYQALGLMDRKHLAVLKPVRQQRLLEYNTASNEQIEVANTAGLIEDCIASYETASYVFKRRLQGEISRP